MQNVQGKSQNISEAFFHTLNSSKIIETICLIFRYVKSLKSRSPLKPIWVDSLILHYSFFIIKEVLSLEFITWIPGLIWRPFYYVTWIFKTSSLFFDLFLITIFSDCQFFLNEETREGSVARFGSKLGKGRKKLLWKVTFLKRTKKHYAYNFWLPFIVKDQENQEMKTVEVSILGTFHSKANRQKEEKKNPQNYTSCV